MSFAPLLQPDIPDIEEWLAYPQAELANYVRPKQLAVLLSIDGSRRHYLLSKPNNDGKITDFADYARHTAQAYTRVYDLLFALGVNTILTPMLYPPNFLRSPDYLQKAILSSQQAFLGEAFCQLYERRQVAARLYGDYDIAPNAAPVRTELTALTASLQALTPVGERQLLFGFAAGSFGDEAIKRGLTLGTQLNRVPTQDEVRAACFPQGPQQINILIGAGWLRVGMILPPLLDGGATDIYNLSHLVLDLQETSLRQILYDHLFRRWAAPEDDANYSSQDLLELKNFYSKHNNGLIGLGQLVGPGIWYADYPNQTATTF